MGSTPLPGKRKCIMKTDPWQVTKAEALLVRCPKCLKPEGEPCVYVPPKANTRFVNTKKWAETLNRVGTRTKVPHQERFSAARLKCRSAWLRKRGRASIRAIPEHILILHAQREWDLAEYWKLRKWLTEHADIFLLNESVLP